MILPIVTLLLLFHCSEISPATLLIDFAKLNEDDMTGKGIAQLKSDEGLRLKPYKCPAGKWTIGWGHQIRPDDDFDMQTEITEEIAEQLLNDDIEDAEFYLRSMFSGYDEFSPNRQDALANIMFNVGIGTFDTFTTVKDGIERNDWNYVGERLKRYKWRRQVGDRADRLIDMIIKG